MHNPSTPVGGLVHDLLAAVKGGSHDIHMLPRTQRDIANGCTGRFIVNRPEGR